MKDYIALTKPRITWFILMSAAIGYCFGLERDSFEWLAWQSWQPFLLTLLGTGLLSAGTAALNQWYERESDFKMLRTAGRPIPGGRLTANSALIFGACLAIGGFALLTLAVNVLSGLLGLFTLVSYLFIYTPLKQRSSLATVIGALPGAMPPMIGYAAASGKLTPEAWALFRDSVLLAISAFSGDCLDVSGRLLPRRHPDAARGRTGRPFDIAADCDLRLHPDPGQPVSYAAWHDREAFTLLAHCCWAGGFSTPACAWR